EASPGAGLGGSGAAAVCGGVDGGVAPVGVGCGVLELGLLNIVAGLHKSEGVLGTAVHPHLVVQVRAGGSSGGAHGADPLADGHMLANTYRDRGKMAISRLKAVSVVYLDSISVA